jgi:hypothetical protein
VVGGENGEITMNRTGPKMALLVLALAWAGAARARDLFVDQKHPSACDTNAGTEAAPFKTIQPAVDQAKPDQIVYVKQGVYSDQVKLRTFGNPYYPPTLTAWKNDRVVIGSELRDLPSAEHWQPIPGHKSFEVKLPDDTPDDMLVILDGKPMATQYVAENVAEQANGLKCRDAPPDDAKLNWAIYRKSDRTLMVNTGDGNPAAMHKIQRARRIEPFQVTETAAYWQIKKLEFAWCNAGIGMYQSTGILVEDCFFHDIYRPAIFGTGRMGTIRRCNFLRCGFGVGGQHGLGGVIEDNLFVQCGMDIMEDIDNRLMNCREGGGVLRFTGGPAIAGIIRYNIIADCKGSIWHDCAGGGLRIIGNALWSNAHGNGVYNEFGVMDTLIMGNYFYHTSVASSYSARMTVADNFFDKGGLSWHNRDPWQLRNSFMTACGNAFTAVHMGYLGGADHGTLGLDPLCYSRAFVDHNRVRVLPNDYTLFRNEKDFCRTLEDIQQKYGWDLHGELKTSGQVYGTEISQEEVDAVDPDLTPESMGGSSVTFRVPWGRRAHLARPMLSDNQIAGVWPAAVEFVGTRMPSFFWRVADGDCSERTFKDQYTDMTSDMLWHPLSDAGYGLGVNHGSTWGVLAEDKYYDPKMHVEKEDFRAEQSSGNHWLMVRGVKPEEMAPAGTGWWTAWMAACPDARTRVSLKIYGKDLQPTAKAMPAVYMQFIDATGRNRTRAYLVGKDDQGVLHRSDLTSGSYGWTNVEVAVTAPTSAVRMALFLGIQPCKGELGFDDIAITTANGPKPAGDIEIVEANLPRIAKERMREINTLDLSKVANRTLADETTGTGKGWLNLGPDLDLRQFPTGDQNFGTVPFHILPNGRAAIVLQGNGKAGADLPQELTIPWGKKTEALYILSAAAFADEKRHEPVFEIELKYKDGATKTWAAWPQWMPDWLAEPVREFRGGFDTTAAYTVKLANGKKGTVYRTEWILDRAKADVPVESVTLRGTKNGVAAILGVTGVTQW